MKRQYELTVVLSSNLDEEQQKTVLGAVEKLVEQNAGKVLSREDWGEKNLAYKIKKHEKGFVVHYLVELETGETVQLEAKLKLEPSVIRQLLVRKD